MSLRAVALGVALGEVDHRVREEGGNNRGERVARYLAGCDPPITVAAPWCAAFVQYVTDVAAKGAGLPNPLDEVRLEAYVQSYWEWGSGRLVAERDVLRGDLLLFNFGGQRWDHVGLVAQPPNAGGIAWCVEGNTGDVSQRDGDGVYLKPRDVRRLRTCFIRWSPS